MYSHECVKKTDMEKKKLLNVTWTILTMSLLPFWVLNMVVVFLFLEGQKALRFNKKYLNLCFKDERMSYKFGMTWGWITNENICILGWSITLKWWHLDQGSSNLAHEIYCPAEYSSNSDQTHLKMLINVFRVIRKSQVGEFDQGWS